MRLETIKKLCCPFDKAELELTSIAQDIYSNIIEGFFICKECKRLYPIVKGIPIMSPDEYREFKMEQPLLDKWKEYLNDKTYKIFHVIAQDDKDNKNRLTK